MHADIDSDNDITCSSSYLLLQFARLMRHPTPNSERIIS